MFLTIPLGWVIRFLFRVLVFFVLMIGISVYLVRGPIAQYRADHMQPAAIQYGLAQ